MSVERIISSGESTVNVSLMNSGDEAANGVQISLQLPGGFKAEPIFLGRMDPNVPQEASFKTYDRSDACPRHISNCSSD